MTIRPNVQRSDAICYNSHLMPDSQTDVLYSMCAWIGSQCNSIMGTVM